MEEWSNGVMEKSKKWNIEKIRRQENGITELWNARRNEA
jgi:hypothetical protein